MARRKKEVKGFHREQIADAAQRLFAEKGLAQTTMDEVAKVSGYSKATVYVHFRSKEDLISHLALRSLQLLRERLRLVLSAKGDVRARYNALCWELTAYQQESPLYFQTALDKIGLSPTCPFQQAALETGEELNAMVGGLLEEGMALGQFRQNLALPQTVLIFWGSLSGLILLAAKKEPYLQMLGQTKVQFLQEGFDVLYRALQSNS